MENILFNEDCFNVFSQLPTASIQLIVVDLPYGLTACDWDVRIDLEKMWEQLKRILKPNGQCVFFCTTKFGNYLINSNPKWFKYDIVWEKSKSAGFLTANKQPLRNHEMIYLFHNPIKQKNLNWIYNPQKTEGIPYSRKVHQSKTDIYGDVNKKEYIFENITGDKHPLSILKIKNHKNKNEKFFHSTQKPVELCEWLIKTYSNEGDLVLDFTMGSGSTIVACINTNRRYIGIEKDEKIFKSAEKRIKER